MRRTRLSLLAFLAVLTVLAPVARAEDRLAHANMEFILSLMPEMKTVMGKLGAFERELTGQLDVKRNYAQQKLEEAQRSSEAGASEETLNGYRTELQGLEREIQELAAQSGSQLAGKRIELLNPIVEKLQATISTVAKRDGYTYVLNSVDGAGTSIVLYGPEERDLTQTILGELGIEVPE